MRNKTNAVVTVVFICLVVSIIGCGKGPAPYTMEAMGKLSKAIESVETPVPKPGINKEESIKLLYDWYKNIYSKAGYDLDKSIIQLASDFKKDPQYAAPALNQSLTLVVSYEFIKIRKDKTIDMSKAIPQDVLNALDNIATKDQK